MRQNITKEEVEDFFIETIWCQSEEWHDYDIDDFNVSFKSEEGYYSFEISVSDGRWNLPPLTFQLLDAFSKFFDTKYINTDNWENPGCESCDYGATNAWGIYVYENSTIVRAMKFLKKLITK